MRGASTKPRLANISSSPIRRTSSREGGKKGGGRLRIRTGSAGTLEKWLLTLGKKSGPSTCQAMDRDREKEGSLSSREGKEAK